MSILTRSITWTTAPTDPALSTSSHRSRGPASTLGW